MDDPSPLSDASMTPPGPAGEAVALEHWRQIARQWRQVGPPLRPTEQDLAVVGEAIRAWGHRHGQPRALVLGVTPEYYHLPWPAGASVLAVDHTQAMIDAVWPGPRGAALCAEWTDLPLAAGSRDIALCDGGLHLLAYPHEQQRFVRALHRVVAPGGLCLLRLFVPPPQRESPAAVIDDLLRRRIASLSGLKFRLWMALQREVARGVALAAVWETVHRVEPDWAQLASHVGWSLEHLSAIDTYRDSATRYCLPTEAAVRQLFCESPGGFTLEARHTPTYELGGQCPTLVLRRVLRKGT
ncbi:MAG: class I SAM-dependent methyltransferase [Phycisphaeraceae bacterium]